ncbi:hypothetical protein AAG570_001354 [Ranatra chinensis]|uniref:Uncharacterized protein n=1 Tax=Ranatra chinensis TaxID=642074 RepID=A0ABD0YBW9_9HEMI
MRDDSSEKRCQRCTCDIAAITWPAAYSKLMRVPEHYTVGQSVINRVIITSKRLYRQADTARRWGMVRHEKTETSEATSGRDVNSMAGNRLDAVHIRTSPDASFWQNSLGNTIKNLTFSYSLPVEELFSLLSTISQISPSSATKEHVSGAWAPIFSFERLRVITELYCDRNMFYQNMKQKKTEIGKCNLPPFCDCMSCRPSDIGSSD